MQTGKIGVTTENIFPVIKKFLYSDHEIFLRELVSNAVDATQKLRTLSSFGEYKGELGQLEVRVAIDAEAGTLTVSDRGIGMTAEDVDKYINQIAFSGAEEFLTKYKDSANSIIGHFGLGFYSAFMVAKKVEIISRSYKEGAKPIRWSCDGSPEYTLEEAEKSDRGTDIILHIDDDNREFLQQSRIDSLLKKYCRFLPVPVISGKEQEWKDGKYVDTEKDKVINATEPSWMKKPSELTDEDYINFYHELYPGQEDPLFWIHLNVDYPFTLTGILFFPKIKNNFEISKNRIQLYCNQVYVTDSVEGVVPEFLMLLQGVIDSPDIPLNVSRSYLQADSAVRKISGYITKKVSSRLEDIFKNDRTDFEKKWDDIRIFIEYGMLTDSKFADAAMKFVLVKDTEGHYYTLDEYKTLVESAQTDKDQNIIYLYATDPAAQYSYINAANAKGYNVLLLDGQLDSHFIGLLEQKLDKTQFVRVDSDAPDKIIRRADQQSADLDSIQRNILTTLFQSRIPKIEGAQILVSFENLGSDTLPVIITQNEYMRRMKDMAAMQPGMNFYGELPDSYNMLVNVAHPLVKKVIDAADEQIKAQVEPLAASVDDANAKIEEINKAVGTGKPDAEQETRISEYRREAEESRKQQTEIISKYAASREDVGQLIDLALLGNGLLKGEHLSNFIKRSVDIMGKA